MEFIKQIISYKSILRREIFRILRIWPQTICPSIITSLMNMLIFGKLVGPHLSNNNHYINFIIPGLVMMSIIINSYENTVSSFFVPKYMRSMEELLISPTPNHVIILGYISGGIIRGLLIGLLVYLSSKIMTNITIINFHLILLVSFMTSLIFSLAGLINAFVAKAFDDISWFPSFVLTPMIMLGGIYYPIDNLQGVWRAISRFNPLFYMIQLFKNCFNAVDNVNISITLFTMGISAMMLFIIAMVLLDKYVRK